MTGPEHYAKAEQILAAVNRRTASDEYLHVREQRLELQAKAQVHATLALAAAMSDTFHENESTSLEAWAEVTQ